MSGKKTILVTGCSDNSLGAALALALHNRGWRVFASARNTSKLAKSKAAGIECLQLDVVSEESISAAVEEVEKLTGGSLDALVNNAGAGYSMPLIHADIDKAHELFELNTFSILRVTRAFLPLLLKSKNDGLVVNNTSCAGLLGCGFLMAGTYNASKAAAVSLTECLRAELAPFGIRVVNLSTGMVGSTFADNAPTNTLPPDSIYNVAKEAVERAMAGPPDGFTPMDSTTWANNVAGDISKSKPSHMLFRGSSSTLARLVTLLPIGWLDHILYQASGLDVVVQNIKKQGGFGNKQ